MDNFRWLEEKDGPKKSQWLKNYWMHIVAAVIIVLLLSYLIFGSGSPESSVNEEPSIAMNTAPETTTQQITIRLPDQTTKTINPKQPLLEEAQPFVEPTAKQPLTLSPQSEPLAAEEPVAESEAPPVAEKPARVSSRLIQPEGAPAQQIGMIAPKTPTQIIEPAPNNVQNTTPPSEELATPAETSAAKTAPATQPPVETLTLTPSTQTSAAPSAKPAPINTTPPATAPATSAPAEAPATSATTIAPSTSATVNLNWLLQRNPSHYTVQLFASHDESVIQAFINQNNLNGKAVYAKIRQNSQDWYIVLMGDYSSRDQALGAVTQLPSNIQAQSPWARSMQSVQDALRKRLAYGD